MNLRGPVFLVQAALPYLKESPYGGGGEPVVGRRVPPVDERADVLGGEGRDARVHPVDGARVGAVRYPCERARARHRRHRHGAQQPARGAGEHGERGPMRRAAHADEMVGPALLLVSDAGSFITGEVLAADGGLVMR